MSVSPPCDDVIKNDLAQQGEQQDDEGVGRPSLRGGAVLWVGSAIWPSL
jgi:hypothetical protein